MKQLSSLEEIFFAALEKGTRAERAAYLDEACAGDTDLRQRVERMLAAQAQAGSFMEQPIRAEPATTAEPRTPELPGTVIGAYKLVEQIGEGGMGAVWMAQQTEPVKRVVAIKLIKAGMDSKQVIARFEAERQAIAMMDHPNIARILEGGVTETGRPYFVMDLVKGVPVTRYCDEHHLTPRQRLELFVPICHAVQHAHQKGIIHRDLKPSNVLVSMYDGRPVPKVIDFGVAKATGQSLTDQTLVTGFGAIVGTLEYMSPEQAEVNQLDIDTRSDIYSLGVLLYELLAGSTPLTHKRMKHAAYAEILRMIKEEEPPKPSTRLSDSGEALGSISANRHMEPAKLTKLVRGELDWIVMKALEKDRDRRYETANGFAMDVQRFLADEPVLAGPPTAKYRLRKFLKRNQGPVIAASIILLCLVAGIIGTSAALVWAVRERDDKAKALLAETQARDRAMTALRDLTEEAVGHEIARGTYLTAEDKEFLRKIITHFEGFAAVTADDAESRAIRAEGYFRVGLMRYRLGELKEAHDAYAEALAARKQLVSDFPARPEFRRELAGSYNNLGALFHDTGRLKDAETAYADALALQKVLAAEFPTRPEFRQEQGKSHHNLGLVYYDTGRLKQAEAAYADALVLRKQLATESPTRREFRQELARSHNSLGNLLRATGRLKDAETAFADALALQKQLAAEFPTRPEVRQELAGSHNNLGLLFSDTGRLKEAETAYGDALALQKGLASDFPTRPEFRQALAASHHNLARLLRVTGRLKEAATAHGDALALQKQLASDFPTRPEFRQELAGSHNRLGALLQDTGRLKEAEAAFADALALQKPLAADFPDRPEYRRDLARTHNNLGRLLRLARRLKDAEVAYADALAAYKQLAADFPTRPEFRQELATSHNNLGNLLSDTGRLKEAEAAFADALGIRKQLVRDFPTRPEFRHEMARSHNSLGNLFSATDRPKEAENAYSDALALFKQLAAEFPNQPDLRNDVAGTCVNLAVQCMNQREFRGANAYLAEAAPYHESALKANSRNPSYRQFYRINLTVQIRANAGLYDQAGAKLAAEKLRDIGWDPSGNAYDAACALSLCISIVQKDDQATKDKRDGQAAFYGDEAMKMLRNAVAKGFNNIEQMKQDKDFDPLRGQEDFKKLLAELEAKKQESGVRN